MLLQSATLFTCYSGWWAGGGVAAPCASVLLVGHHINTFTDTVEASAVFPGTIFAVSMIICKDSPGIGDSFTIVIAVAVG